MRASGMATVLTETHMQAHGPDGPISERVEITQEVRIQDDAPHAWLAFYSNDVWLRVEWLGAVYVGDRIRRGLASGLR